MNTERSSRPFWLGKDERVWDHVRVHIQLIKDPRLGAPEIAVYCGLTVHAELESGRARPSLDTLAEYTGLSTWKVRDAARRLEECSYVAINQRAGKASIYRLLPPPEMPAEVVDELHRRRFDNDDQAEVDPSVSQRGTSFDPRPRVSRATPPRQSRTTPASDAGDPRVHRATPPRPPRHTPASTAHEREPGTRTQSSSSESAVGMTDDLDDDRRRRDLIEKCWDVLAQRDLALRLQDRPTEPVFDRSAWLASARARRRGAHELEAGEVLQRRPDLTAEQLADAVTGRLASTATDQERARAALEGEARNLAYAIDSADDLVEFLRPKHADDPELIDLVRQTWHDHRAVATA